MITLRLYCTAIVLTVWTLIWSLGWRSDELVGAALACTAISLIVAERQRQKLRRHQK
jgi:hypothetical protein